MLTETRQVKDLMTTDPVTVKPTDSVETVLRCLEENHISGLPVVDEIGRAHV